ncbi:dihydroorotase [Calothrix sp. 336/3]|uniref:dihydroorotase n=1 Tax=Calothrix sp. 336/3 TaxID=1337936 RepID=UPI0004E3A4D5|nr:dihydroorotase [Calothrix sp. 336/3]AKG20464.1 dihydroorotase [Calothrix sp. 336/3]
MITELLQQVRVIDPVAGTDAIADVLISKQEGINSHPQIVSVAATITDIPQDAVIHDCRGLLLGTGLVDLYSHSGEPGFEERETLTSLLQAATAGGFTRICILPDTSPIIDHPGVVTQLLQATASATPSIYLWGSLTLNAAGKQMTEFADLLNAGVVGFAESQPWENLGTVRRILEYLQPLGKPVLLWCCDRQLAGNGVMREGTDSIRFGLPGNPTAAETSAVAALIELVATTGTPVHIMRVSTARSVELIAAAKSQGIPVTASTTWMHLLLDTSALQSYHPSLHLEPPLGNPQDRIALRRAVKTGIIEAIAIDHAPYTYEEKTVAFAESPPGAIGLELALPLLWSNLVATGEFTALELWQAMSSRPGECLQQKIPAIIPGNKAELTLFDPHKSWQVAGKYLHTLSRNTPWLGENLTGKVLQTWN